MLLHLQVVMGAKLRRGETFQFTFKDDRQGRTSVSVHPGISLISKFYGSKSPAINPAWIDALTRTANSPLGLHLIPEPGEPTPIAAAKPPDRRRGSHKSPLTKNLE